VAKSVGNRALSPPQTEAHLLQGETHTDHHGNAMVSAMPSLDFDSSRLDDALQSMTPEQLDALPFGVIGFDPQGHIVQYNDFEARAAHFPRQDVLGQHLFVELAPCLNNYLVAGRFDEALEQGALLDETLPYVLTFRMRPTRVRLRLIASSGHDIRYVLVDRG
jgi:photoactive yellow protein